LRLEIIAETTLAFFWDQRKGMSCVRIQLLRHNYIGAFFINSMDVFLGHLDNRVNQTLLFSKQSLELVTIQIMLEFIID